MYFKDESERLLEIYIVYNFKERVLFIYNSFEIYMNLKRLCYYV